MFELRGSESKGGETLWLWPAYLQLSKAKKKYFREKMRAVVEKDAEMLTLARDI